ncbi:MAG: hypothetical protein ACYS8K_00355 [Planctomycetota bacterium]|jgi:hypothetical protein
MKRSALFAALAFLLFLPAAPLLAQETFELDYTEVSDTSDPLLSVSRQFQPPQPAAPPSLKAAPAGVSGEPVYYLARIGDAPVLVALSPSRPPKLFVDTDGDGDLAEEKPVSGGRKGGFLAGGVARFGPVTVKLPAAGGEVAAKLRFEVHGAARGGYLFVLPAGIRSGAVKLGGRTYDFAVVDGDLNGRYDGVYAPEGRHDWLGIDLNGDGRFDRDVYGSAELLPLPRMMRVKDVYYAVGVAADGSTVSFQQVAPKLGTLDVGDPHATLTILGESGYYLLKASEGKWELPAGRHSAVRLALNQTDAKGRKWEISCRSETGKLKDFEIREGQTTSIGAGAPLKVNTTAVRSGRNVLIGLEVYGQAGEEYSPGAERDGTDVPPPRFRIRDEAENIVTSGRFEYG